MYGQHVAPQTHNKRTGLSIRDVKMQTPESPPSE